MMPKYFIKSISIEGFRGINNNGNPLVIDFNPNGVTSIFGENGKGKSSIYEALLFSILGRIVRFDEYHGDIKDRGTIKNIFHSGDGDIKISFIDDSKNIVDIDIKVNSNGERTIRSTSISQPDSFLASLYSSLNFLDYKSFEKIMITSSEETGKLFSNLVGYGGFITIKDKLDKISRTQNVNTDFGKSAKEEAIRVNNQKISELTIEIQKTLKEIGIETESVNVKDTLKIIRSFVRRQYSLKNTGKITDAKIDFDELIKTKIGPDYENNILQLNASEEEFRNILVLERGINSLKKVNIARLNKLLKSSYTMLSSSNDIVLGQLYDAAIKSYDNISDFNKNTCVLCSTQDLSNSGNTFYQQVNAKVKSYYKFRESYETFFSDYSLKVQTSKIIEIEKEYIAEVDWVFSKIAHNGDYFKSDFFEAMDFMVVITKYKNVVKKEKMRITSFIKEYKSLIPPKISELVELSNRHKFLFNSIVEVDKLLTDNEYNRKYLIEIQNWTSFVSDLKEEYEEAYNVLMDEIASNIDTDTKLFFKEIMGNIEIVPKLRKEYRAQKVNILLEKFYNNGIEHKAASLLSESYRNALSLSIYFAAALKSKNPGNFIIVDDISSSFDSGHQLFLLDLIKRKISISPTNKNGKQIIFLTHDGLLRKVLNENNSLKNWTHFNLNANKDVVSLKSFESSDLKSIINDKIMSGSYLGSDFRMYYEFVLLEIIEKLNLEIPFSLINSNEEKMVSKLSSAIHEIVELKRKSNKVRIVAARFPSKNDFKTSTQQLSNNLSHWASGSQISLSVAVLNKIIDDIDVFKRIFQYNCTCSEVNAGWVYYKSLSSPKLKGCKCSI